MKDNKKSVVEEALAEFSLIQESLNSNAKEILRSVAKEEINSTLNESLNIDISEDEYDIEDIEDVDSDVDALPVDDASVDGPMGGEPEMGADMGAEMGGSEELGLDDIEMDAGEEGPEMELDTEEGSDDYGIEDMTGASDEDVISVYKKLQGEDEIEVVSSDEVIIKDPVSGAEYNVKMGKGGSAIDQGEMNLDGELEAEPEMGLEPEIEAEPEMGAEMDAEPEMGADMDADLDAEPEMDSEEGEEAEEEVEDTDDDDDLGESVVYEIELSEDDEITEALFKDSKIGNTANGIVRTATGDVENSMGGDIAKGDIEGQKASKDSDSGDNLVGGFDDKGKNGSGDAHAQHIMEDEDAIDESEEVIDEEDVVEGDEAIDEKISTNRVRTNQAGGDLTDITGPGGKAGRKDESTQAKKLAEAVTKYNTLLAEARKIKTENDMFRTSLKDFRKTITETAVFNINLTHATKLFLEHSTTSDEKKNILSRFDEEVNTIEESKKLYKSINSELGNKAPITESIENKLVSEKSSGTSRLNETTAYVDPAQSRVLDLIRRTSK